MTSKPPYPHLTYKSAALSIRATSDLSSPRPRHRRLPFPRDNPQRSVTTLASTANPRPSDQRTLSASALPPRTPRQPIRLFRPIHDDLPRRTRSPHKLPSKSTLPRNTAKPSKSKSHTSNPSILRQPSRAVYKATTASQRAVQLTKTTNFAESMLGHTRQGGDRAEREGDELCSVPFRESKKEDEPDNSASSIAAYSAISARRGARIVVKRRLIRGTSVFRPATEADLEELLQSERYREMVMCVEAAVDVPPMLPNARPLAYEDLMESETDLSAHCLNPIAGTKRQGMGWKGMRRVSSLLSRHLGSDVEERSLNISEMAAMDDCSAVAVFLKEIRKCRRDMLMSLQDKALDRTNERGSSVEKRRDAKRLGREMRMVRREELDKFRKMMKQERRSLSADDPVLMRALTEREHLLYSHSVNRRKKSALGKQVANEGKTRVNKETDTFENDFNRERSHSELVLRVASEESDDKRWRRTKSSFGRTESSNRPVKGTKTVRIAENVRTESGMKSDVETERGGTGETEDEDDGGGNGIRILTALEPMDPSMGLEEDDARRGTSYHTGSGTHGYAGNRRRLLTRGIQGGESSFLRRLRTLRRRTEERV